MSLSGFIITLHLAGVVGEVSTSKIWIIVSLGYLPGDKELSMFVHSLELN